MANKYTATSYVTDTELQCPKCGEIKLHKDFPKDPKNIRRKGRGYYCNLCAAENSRRNYKKRLELDRNKERSKKKDAYIKLRYGITLQEYEDRIEQQKVCSICGVRLSTNDSNTHLDHCHTTGKLRSFLCGNCNRGIGSFKDNVHLLLKAIDYLNSHNNKC